MKLLANIGCVNISKIECDGGDGVVTKLGCAVSKLPLGVRVSFIFGCVLILTFLYSDCRKLDS